MQRIKLMNLALGVVLAGAVFSPVTAQRPPAQQPSPRAGAAKSALIAPQRAAQLVGQASRQAVAALQKDDTATLARLMHPGGLRFGPYINLSKRDLVFRRSSVAALRRSARLYNWGEDDGTGDPLRLTWNAFRWRHLTPKGRDFLKGQVNFNTFKSRGNLINNLREVYPGAIFVEFYLPGSDESNYMDWRGLWLVWRPVGKAWRLCAIVGDQWTT